jgi:hypothetical protein
VTAISGDASACPWWQGAGYAQTARPLISGEGDAYESGVESEGTME